MPRKPPGRPFKKGNKANPLGAGAHNPDMRRLRNLTTDELVEVGSLLLGSNLPELEALKDSREESAFKIWISSIILNAIKYSKTEPLNMILDRLIGKVKDVSVSTVTLSAPPITEEQMIESHKKAEREY